MTRKGVAVHGWNQMQGLTAPPAIRSVSIPGDSVFLRMRCLLGGDLLLHPAAGRCSIGKYRRPNDAIEQGLEAMVQKVGTLYLRANDEGYCSQA